MDKQNTVKFGDVKAHNQIEVLYHIYLSKEAGISQSVIAKKIGLSAPSVFRIFSFLEDKQIIIPAAIEKKDQKLIGRNPSKYCVNPNFLFTCAVEITNSFLELQFLDFAQNCLKHISYNIAGKTTEELFEEATALIENEIISLKLPREKFFGIGIAIPGIINSVSGTIINSESERAIKNFALAEKVKAKLNCNVVVRNNTAAASYYDYKYSDKYGKTLFSLLLRYSINGAVLDRGKIFRDSKNNNVDFGHITVSTDGPKCVCGKTGCLQSFIDNIEGKFNPNIIAELEDLLLDDLPRLDTITNKIVDYIIYIYENVFKIINPDKYLILAKNEGIANIVNNKLKHKLIERYPQSKDNINRAFIAEAYSIDKCLKGVSELLLESCFSLDTINSKFTVN